MRKEAAKASLPLEKSEDWAQCCGNAADLLQNLVVFDPRKRFSCPEALQHKRGGTGDVEALEGLTHISFASYYGMI